MSTHRSYAAAATSQLKANLPSVSENQEGPDSTANGGNSSLVRDAERNPLPNGGRGERSLFQRGGGGRGTYQRGGGQFYRGGGGGGQFQRGGGGGRGPNGSVFEPFEFHSDSAQHRHFVEESSQRRSGASDSRRRFRREGGTSKPCRFAGQCWMAHRVEHLPSSASAYDWNHVETFSHPPSTLHPTALESSVRACRWRDGCRILMRVNDGSATEEDHQHMDRFSHSAPFHTDENVSRQHFRYEEEEREEETDNWRRGIPEVSNPALSVSFPLPPSPGSSVNDP